MSDLRDDPRFSDNVMLSSVLDALSPPILEESENCEKGVVDRASGNGGGFGPRDLRARSDSGAPPSDGEVVEPELLSDSLLADDDCFIRWASGPLGIRLFVAVGRDEEVLRGMVGSGPPAALEYMCW